MAIGATRVLLLRHGQSTWNAEGRWQGQADPPLSALGEKQARDAAAHLSAVGFDAIVASDLQRARRTAELIATELDLEPVVLDPDLRERDVGAFSGLTENEVYARFPDCFNEAGRILRIPDGEADTALVARTVSALDGIASRHPGGTVLAVAHGGVIRFLERHLGLEPPPSTANLGGRWFVVGPARRAIRGGDPVVPVDIDLETTPPSR